MNILPVVAKIAKVAGSLEVLDKLAKSENVRKAAGAVQKSGRRVAGKVTRRDELGKKIFRYDKKKLSFLFSKDMISEKVYDYLIGEQKHMDALCSDHKNFEKLFLAIIKAKNDVQLKKAINKYEKIRNKYT